MIQYLGEFNARNRFVLMKDRLLVFKIIKIKIYLLLDITYSLIYSKIINNIFGRHKNIIIFRRLEQLKQ